MFGKGLGLDVHTVFCKPHETLPFSGKSALDEALYSEGCMQRHQQQMDDSSSSDDDNGVVCHLSELLGLVCTCYVSYLLYARGDLDYRCHRSV